MQLVEEDELTWDDGSVNPEKCLDEFPLFTKVGLFCPLPWQIAHSVHPDIYWWSVRNVNLANLQPANEFQRACLHRYIMTMSHPIRNHEGKYCGGVVVAVMNFILAARATHQQKRRMLLNLHI